MAIFSTTASRAAEQQQQQLQALKQATGGVPFSPFEQQTPTGQLETILNLQNAGGQAGADVASELTSRLPAMQQPGPTGGKIGAPSPKDFTIQSLDEFSRTGDVSGLVRWVDPLALQRANQSNDRLILAQLTSSRPSPAQQEKMIADQISLDTLDSVINQSDERFFGLGFDIVGDARIEVARRFGNESEIQYLDFWREYENWILNIRKEKFGTQFTPLEERVFNRLKAKPSDSYRTGMRNIQQQREMVSRARLRRRSVLEEFGFTVPDGPGRTQPDNEIIDRTDR